MLKDPKVRKNILKGIGFLFVLFGFSVVLSVYFESAMLEFSNTILSEVGRSGLFLVVLINDCIISPLPPDLFLLMLAKNENSSSEGLYVSLLGLASTLGGTLAWMIASKLGKPKWFGTRFQNFVRQNHELINRYGRWAVGLAALTPIPFSLTSWAAGFVKMDFRSFFLMALLRIPRFLAYFYVLIFSGQLAYWIR